MSWKPVPFGASSWQQTSWDARAAGNFIGGGAGSGLVIFAVLAGTTASTQIGLLIAGLALVGLGLFSVSLELGRPLRAINVFRNPRTSWMSREAICGGLLGAAVVAAAAGVDAARPLAAIAALGFLYCQSRLLQGAKGIPAWRERAIVPTIVTTGLAEGAGVFWLSEPVHRSGTLALLGVFVVLVIVRYFVWRAYRERVEPSLAAPARAALDRAGSVLRLGGTWAPFVLAAIAAGTSGAIAQSLAAVAGACAVAGGVYLKHALLTRAAFNQGYAIPHVPVRGQRA